MLVGKADGDGIGVKRRCELSFVKVGTVALGVLAAVLVAWRLAAVVCRAYDARTIGVVSIRTTTSSRAIWGVGCVWVLASDRGILDFELVI